MRGWRRKKSIIASSNELSVLNRDGETKRLPVAFPQMSWPGRVGISYRIGSVWPYAYDSPYAPIQPFGQLGGSVPQQRIEVLDIEVI